MNVSAATVRRFFLDPGLDARALNLRQAALVANDTPECDSLLEHLAGIRPDNAWERAHLAGLRDLAVSLADANQAEGGFELVICGAADQLTRDLRGVELNGISGVLNARAIAELLRKPLQTLRAVEDGEFAGTAADLLDATRAVDDAIRRVPAAQLFAPKVRRELWDASFNLLVELYERRTGRRPFLAPLPPAGAGARPTPPDAPGARETSGSWS